MACEFQNEYEESSAGVNECIYSPAIGKAAMEIWRTKSLDDEHPSFHRTRNMTASLAGATESTRCLHSSFNASLLLDSKSSEEKWFTIAGQRGNTNQIRKEFSGKKHMRQIFQINVTDVSLAGTFQKQARSSFMNRSILCPNPSEVSNFEFRASALKDCSSASKRRRMPTEMVRSPSQKEGIRIGDPLVTAPAYQRYSARELSLSPTKESGRLSPNNRRGVTSTMTHPTDPFFKVLGQKQP